MNENKSQSASTVTAGMIGGSVVGAILGLALLVLGIGFDWSGFGGGMAMGVGVGLAMISMFFCGLAVGMRRSTTRTLWRPSEGPAQ